ncbi:MAG: type II toxin-antitoxin system RelE/ParE family toxin [bacterium]|nr:type II toxin-antitoxin system RelE/ParE family toxin [bacterium]
MAFILKIKPKAEKNLDSLNDEDYNRAMQVLSAIRADPFSGKKLHGKHKDEYTVRVWPFRIIYKIYKQELLISVIKFEHRKDVYK